MRIQRLEGLEKTFVDSLICEELIVMLFVVGVLLCRSESCLVADFLIFAIYVDGKEITRFFV